MIAIRLLIGIMFFLFGAALVFGANKSTSPATTMQIGATIFCTGLIMIFCGNNSNTQS